MDAVTVAASQPHQTASGKVQVYRFKRFGVVQDDEVASEIYATRRAIERFEGEMIVGTAMEVDRSELDGFGRYHPET